MAAALTLASAIADANVQWSPGRPVRLIVPFPPGSAVDVIGRACLFELVSDLIDPGFDAGLVLLAARRA